MPTHPNELRFTVTGLFFASSLVAVAPPQWLPGRGARCEHTSSEVCTAEPSFGCLAPNLNNLGLLLMDAERASEGIPFVERAIGISTEAMGESHWTVGFTTRSLALLHLANGDKQPALELGNKALAAVSKALGADHLRTDQVRASLAKINMASGNLVLAQELAERTQTAFEEKMGQDSLGAKKNAKLLATIRARSSASK
ncbi:MAG: tetratricopeptide repeat protein [Myxococcota bacterium]